MANSIVDEAIRLLSNPLSRPIGELSLLQQSLLFAEIAKISYHRPDVVWEAVSAVGFEEYQYFDQDGAQAYIIANQYDCVVACRGTEPNEWNDIVTRVPPPWLGYTHCGREMYLNAFGQLGKYTPWRKLRDRWYGFYLTLRKWNIAHLADHSMAKYVQCIKYALDEETVGKSAPVLKDVQ